MKERKLLQRNPSRRIIAGVKVDARIIQQKKSTGFCRMSVCAFLQGNLKMAAFSYHRFMFLLVCIVYDRFGARLR